MYGPRPDRASKLDPYTPYIEQRLAAARPHWVPASVIDREIRHQGYPGSIRLLRYYMAALKPVARPDPVVRFETRPGQQMQVDWGVFRRGRDSLSAFVAALGWSRYSYVEFVSDERFATLKSCHENAFSYFQGVFSSRWKMGSDQLNLRVNSCLSLLKTNSVGSIVPRGQHHQGRYCLLQPPLS